MSPTSGAAGSASITIKVKENESTDERNASVTITGGKASASVKITQKEKEEPTKIYYTSTDKCEIIPDELKAYDTNGNKLKYDNTYGEEGGVIEFNGKVHRISLQYRSGQLLSIDKISNMVYVEELGFRGCTSLQTIDFSNFNTENVTDMEQMFRGCSSLQKLKVGEGTNKGKVGVSTFSEIGRDGTLSYPQGCDYSEWLSDKYLGGYGWTGQTY